MTYKIGLYGKTPYFLVLEDIDHTWWLESPKNGFPARFGSWDTTTVSAPMTRSMTVICLKVYVGDKNEYVACLLGELSDSLTQNKGMGYIARATANGGPMLDQDHPRNGLYIYKGDERIQWSSTTYEDKFDWSYAWVGFGGRSTFQVPGLGRDLALMRMVNAAGKGRSFWAQLDTWRYGVGAGGGAGLAICVMTGFNDWRDINGFQIQKWDWGVSVFGVTDVNKIAKILGGTSKAAKLCQLAVTGAVEGIYQDAYGSNLLRLIIGAAGTNCREKSIAVYDVFACTLEVHGGWCEGKVTAVP